MGKGTPSMGRKSGKKSHIACRRCGSRSFHVKNKVCSKCGYGKTPRTRHYNWMKK